MFPLKILLIIKHAERKIVKICTDGSSENSTDDTIDESTDDMRDGSSDDKENLHEGVNAKSLALIVSIKNNCIPLYSLEVLKPDRNKTYVVCFKKLKHVSWMVKHLINNVDCQCKCCEHSFGH